MLDNGFVSMHNSGGSLFLNEFGSAGIHGKNASIGGDNSATLGSSNFAITVDSDGFTFKQGPDKVTVSLDKIREVFGDG